MDEALRPPKNQGCAPCGRGRLGSPKMRSCHRCPSGAAAGFGKNKPQMDKLAFLELFPWSWWGSRDLFVSPFPNREFHPSGIHSPLCAHPQVAIKSIRKDKIKDEQDLVHIRREIEIMSSLNHPHIIAVHEGEASSPFPFPAASKIRALGTGWVPGRGSWGGVLARLGGLFLFGPDGWGFGPVWPG